MNIPLSDIDALTLLRTLKCVFNNERATTGQLLALSDGYHPAHAHIERLLTPLTNKLSTASYTHSFVGYAIETIKLIEATSIDQGTKIRDLILSDEQWIECQDKARRALSNQVKFCLTYLDGLNQGKQ